MGTRVFPGKFAAAARRFRFKSSVFSGPGFPGSTGKYAGGYFGYPVPVEPENLIFKYSRNFQNYEYSIFLKFRGLQNVYKKFQNFTTISILQDNIQIIRILFNMLR